MYPLTGYARITPPKVRADFSSDSTLPGEKNQNLQMNNLKEKNVNSTQNSTSGSLKTDVYESLSPLYHISKICGLFPVEMTPRSGGIYSGTLDKTAVVYGFLLVTVFIAAQTWGLWRDFRDGWKNSSRLSSQTALTVTFSDVMALVSFMISAILSSPFRWKYSQKTMNILAEVDEKVGFLNVKRLRRITIALISSPLLFLFIITVVDFRAWTSSNEKRASKLLPDKGPINYSPLYFMYVVNTVFEVQYALFTFNVAERFSRLNKFTKRLLKNNRIREYSRNDSEIVNEPEKTNLAFIIASDLGYLRPRKISTLNWVTTGSRDNRSLVCSISSIMTMHGNLCDSATFLNSGFGVPLLIGVLGCMLHLIDTTYFMYTETKQEDYNWYFFIIQPFWVMFHIIRLLIVVQPCYLAIVKAKETATLISETLTLRWDTNVRRQLEMFSLQMLHRPLTFSACGLFSLDRGLVTSIAGAVTTYLVILVQFQNEDDCIQGSQDLKNATEILKNFSSIQASKNT